MVLLCAVLTVSELISWWKGTETHHFSVERGIGHELQLNLDIVIAMQCKDLHVNVQDAAMDRILAGELLGRDPTNWQMWTEKLNSRRRSGAGQYKELGEDDASRKLAEEEDQHVGHVIGHMREGSKKFPKTPRLRRKEQPDSCRIYGSLEGNKVQGDFHITARGHGYMDLSGQFQQHLEHTAFNFSHYITELSFGPHYPSLLNPLDKTASTTPENFYKYQYYLSIVPTIFTKRRVSTKSGALDPAAIPQPPDLDLAPLHDKKSKTSGEVKHVAHPKVGIDTKSVFTNQYAATSQSFPISSAMIPGVFFKYDIEPILLIVSEQRGGFLALVVRLVNVISGVLVAGGWMFQIVEWLVEMGGKRRNGTGGYGMLHGRSSSMG